jgi:hypothetical protein
MRACERALARGARQPVPDRLQMRLERIATELNEGRNQVTHGGTRLVTIVNHGGRDRHRRLTGTPSPIRSPAATRFPAAAPPIAANPCLPPDAAGPPAFPSHRRRYVYVDITGRETVQCATASGAAWRQLGRGDCRAGPPASQERRSLLAREVSRSGACHAVLRELLKSLALDRASASSS